IVAPSVAVVKDTLSLTALRRTDARADDAALVSPGDRFDGVAACGSVAKEEHLIGVVVVLQLLHHLANVRLLSTDEENNARSFDSILSLIGSERRHEGDGIACVGIEADGAIGALIIGTHEQSFVESPAIGRVLVNNRER